MNYKTNLPKSNFERQDLVWIPSLLHERLLSSRRVMVDREPSHSQPHHRHSLTRKPTHRQHRSRNNACSSSPGLYVGGTIQSHGCQPRLQLPCKMPGVFRSWFRFLNSLPATHYHYLFPLHTSPFSIPSHLEANT